MDAPTGSNAMRPDLSIKPRRARIPAKSQASPVRRRLARAIEPYDSFTQTCGTIARHKGARKREIDKIEEFFYGRLIIGICLILAPSCPAFHSPPDQKAQAI